MAELSLRMKSSADSISRSDGPDGRDPLPILPFGAPVLKLMTPACSDHAPVIVRAAQTRILLIVFILFFLHIVRTGG